MVHCCKHPTELILGVLGKMLERSQLGWHPSKQRDTHKDACGSAQKLGISCKIRRTASLREGHACVVAVSISFDECAQMQHARL